MVFHSEHSKTFTHTHLEDLLDAVDGGGEQRADLLVVVDVVGVPQTHEQDVGGEPRDEVHSNATRLQLWRQTERDNIIIDVY